MYSRNTNTLEHPYPHLKALQYLVFSPPAFPRLAPHPSLKRPHVPLYTTPSNSFNYNKQFIRSIRDPPTGIKWRVCLTRSFGRAQNPPENTRRMSQTI